MRLLHPKTIEIAARRVYIPKTVIAHYWAEQCKFFDDSYLFSDACSLYFKGINIFPDIFGDQWRKYVPVENYKEILRQINKHNKI